VKRSVAAVSNVFPIVSPATRERAADADWPYLERGVVGDQLANLIGLPEFQGARLGPLESCSAAQLFRRFAGSSMPRIAVYRLSVYCTKAKGP